jgi:tetratricopeptide (TPR) repeat protein
MERREQMDSAGRAPALSALFLRAFFFLAIACFALSAPAQENQELSNLQRLSTEERWRAIVALVEASPQRSADSDYYYGLALARLQRWEPARKALLAGKRLAPHDKRFPIELAGVDFVQKKYFRAARYLHRALRLDPHDSYANDFLGTVYFLQGNLEAALKYWNRVDKPRIDHVRTDDSLLASPILLDHAFAFSPASTLTLRDLLTSENRLQGLGIFPAYRFELVAVPQANFDLVFHAQERNGFGNSTLERVIALLSGLPYQQIDPEYYNFHRRAINFVSLFRWDSEKRRLFAALSGPVRQDPRWRYRFSTDLRNENWDIRDSGVRSEPLLSALNLRREEANAEITRFFWQQNSWSLETQLSHRDNRSVLAGVVLTPELLAQGYELKQSAQLNLAVLRLPERRFTVDSLFSAQAARVWSTPAESFAKLQGGLQAKWFPRAQRDDLETNWRVQAGKTFGDLPFDELFMLGLERDNDLPLRAHIGTHDGRKGSAPLGRNYFLSNWETDKELYRNGIVTLKLGPFLDTGKITDPISTLGSHKWLWDTGAQAKFYVLGVGIAFSYGKDLRTGRNAIYTRLVK